MLMGKDLVVRKEAENTGDEGILINSVSVPPGFLRSSKGQYEGRGEGQAFTGGGKRYISHCIQEDKSLSVDHVLWEL